MLQELSSNPEPGGSRPAGRAVDTRLGPARFLLLVCDGLSLTTGAVGKSRGLCADWVYGNREARPGLK